MSTVVRKSQFHDDGAGGLVLHGHLEPVVSLPSGEELASKVDEDSEAYVSSNEAVATVNSDADKLKFTIKWVGAGTVQIQGTADADLGDGVVTIGGTLDLELQEDQATKLNLVLDDLA